MDPPTNGSSPESDADELVQYLFPAKQIRLLLIFGITVAVLAGLIIFSALAEWAAVKLRLHSIVALLSGKTRQRFAVFYTTSKLALAFVCLQQQPPSFSGNILGRYISH